MKWTNEMPTQPGFYWLWNGHYMSLVEIFREDDRLWTTYLWMSDNFKGEPEIEYWHGPVVMPEPPTGIDV